VPPVALAPSEPPTVGTDSGPAVPAVPAAAASEPAARDVTVDFLRGLAILAVAVGHWLVVVPAYRNGTFDGVNALATVPLMGRLTWIFQVMPLFFILGGFANGISWRSARRREVPYPDWLRTRLVRLVKPTAALLAVWIGIGVVLRAAGADPAFVARIAWLVVVPLWFLAVYVVVVALAPVMLSLHDRAGVAVLVALVALAAAVEYIRIATTIDGIGWTNFLWVFLAAQQIGFFWLDGRLSRRRWMPWAMLVGGLGALWLATHIGPYPVSMVGVPGEAIANNAPPTITLILLGIAQAGAGLLARPRINRWLERRAVVGAVIGLNRNAMTILLWHFTALVMVALVVLPLGVVPVLPDGSPAWWLVRCASVLAYAGPLALLVAGFGRIERRGSTAASTSTAPDRWRQNELNGTGRMVLATAVFAAAFSVITVGGLSDPGRILGVPVVGAGLFLAATALLGRRATAVG
jgi:fucose 4-O-acetylase-like acetyltransferase